MARPERIALAADPRSLPRAAMVIPGDAERVWMNSRDVAVLSMSTANTWSPRTTAALKVKPRTVNAITGTPNSRKRATGSPNSQRTSRAATAHSPRGGGVTRDARPSP
jgi:hypothetical protein